MPLVFSCSALIQTLWVSVSDWHLKTIINPDFYSGLYCFLIIIVIKLDLDILINRMSLNSDPTSNKLIILQNSVVVVMY